MNEPGETVDAVTPSRNGSAHATGGVDAPSDTIVLPPAVEQRLSALADSIRAWDWRTQVLDDPAPPPLTAESAPAPVQEAAPATEAVPASPRQPVPPAPTSSGWPEPWPEAASTDSAAAPAWLRKLRHPTDRQWLVVALAGVVIAIVATVLLLTAGSGPPHLPPAPQSTPHVDAAPGSVVVTQFVKLTTDINAANSTLKAELATAGTRQNVALVTTYIPPYAQAVRNYQFELHYLPWPTSMSADVGAIYAQLQSYSSLLSSVLSINQVTLEPWLAELNLRAATVQGADNHIRNDLGLRSSHLFP